MRFLFENLSDVRRCSCIADLLAADSVTLFLQGSKATHGSKTFVKALDDMFKPQPPTMQYEPGMMQGLRSLGCKASPPSSLFALFCRHAMFLSQVSDVGRLWAEFVRELRWYWENVDQLPAVCSQPPDHSTGYIEQKLCMLQLCIHRTRIAQQRKVNGTGISLSKTIKRQAFNKDRRLRLTATTKPNGRKSTSLIDFSLPPRTPPRSSAAARGDAPAAGSVAEQDVVRVGGHVVALSGDAGSEQVDEDVDFERHDGASDVSHDDGSVHSDEDVLSGQESDEGGQACGGDAPKQLRDDARDMQHDLHCHDSLETHPLPALSSSERAPPHSAASSSSAAGEGWDNLSPFADVDVVAAAAKDGGVGEGRIALLPLDGLLFHDVPMYEPELQPPSPFTEDTAAMQQQQMLALGVDQMASDTRSRMQTVQLHSDMCAFKAANPCAVFADFLRWYSPRDFICDQLEDYEPDRIERDGSGDVILTLGDASLLGLDVPAGAVPRIRGRISVRMLAPGNLWYTTWCESKPVAAANQKSIFDAVKEAEMVLHDLENITPRVLWQEMLLSSVASVHHSMSIAAGAQLDCVSSLLESAASQCCSTLPNLDGLDDAELSMSLPPLLDAFAQAEALVSSATSLVFKMRGCQADTLQALLRGKQQLLVDESSRLAAASVVGIGKSPPNYWRATVNSIPPDADPASSCRVTLAKSPLGLLKSTYAVRQ